jgi:hypothetical protein
LPALLGLRPHVLPLLAAIALVAAWLLTNPRTADLAAAVYRSQLLPATA